MKGISCPKMGTIKDTNGRDLVPTEEFKKRSKNTQKNCTEKILINWITKMMWFCDCGFHSVCPLMNWGKRLMEAS